MQECRTNLTKWGLQMNKPVFKKAHLFILLLSSYWCNVLHTLKVLIKSHICHVFCVCHLYRKNANIQEYAICGLSFITNLILFIIILQKKLNLLLHKCNILFLFNLYYFSHKQSYLKTCMFTLQMSPKCNHIIMVLALT